MHVRVKAFRFATGTRNLSLFKPVQTGFEKPFDLKLDRKGGMKQPERESHHSLHLVYRLRKSGIIPPLSQVTLVCRAKILTLRVCRFLRMCE
jgi:hypothetical protein